MSNARRVREDDPRHGPALDLGTTFGINSDTRVYVSLPRQHPTLDLEMPFVLHIGSNAVHMQRAEVQRVHDLLGRALDAHDQAATS